MTSVNELAEALIDIAEDMKAHGNNWNVVKLKEVLERAGADSAAIAAVLGRNSHDVHAALKKGSGTFVALANQAIVNTDDGG
jgi:hypothetical protein